MTLRFSTPASLQDVQNYYFFTSDEISGFNREAKSKGAYFFIDSTYITPRALLMMIKHGERGGIREVIGYCFGVYKDGSHLISDIFTSSRLGTFVSVEIGSREQGKFLKLKSFMDKLNKQGSHCAWYHTHPGYGPFLSYTDVTTQSKKQKMFPTIGALVLDPIQTKKSGRLYLGAFHCYHDECTRRDRRVDSTLANENAFNELAKNNKDAKTENISESFSSYYSTALSFFLTEADLRVLRFINSSIACITSFSLRKSQKVNQRIANYVVDTIDKSREPVRCVKGTVFPILEKLNSDQKLDIYSQNLKTKIFG